MAEESVEDEVANIDERRNRKRRKKVKMNLRRMGNEAKRFGGDGEGGE